MEAILDGNKSQYSNLVKDIETDYDSQLAQLSLLLKEVFNELIDLKASHAAFLAANNEITNELTALRNDVTSHLQTQSQRLTETNDLRDSHAALLVATNEIAKEVVELRNDITSHFKKQSHMSDSQGWTSDGKYRRPIDIQNKFKALEVSDGDISPKASEAKPDENSPLIINADRSTPMTLADQLTEYRLEHKQKFISQSTTAIPEPPTQPSIANSTDTALNSSKQVPVSTDKPTEACLICLLYTSPSPRDLSTSRMPSSA